ncbi:MAG: hypothetical protein JKY88_03615 [Pseudomonadales bacterium]|nr:hypothetical protein [Pseudomonadales bacterium]
MDAQKLQSDIESIMGILDADAIQEHLQTPLLRVSLMFCPELSPKDGSKKIYEFLVSYINVGPGNMYSLSKEGEQHNLESIIDAYLALASRYLGSACDEIERAPNTNSLKSFLSLLHGAYIFHRLLEELDDRFQNFIGIPLTAHDMVNANLIAHEVIGDRFANRLDKVILSLFQQSIITKTIVEAQLDKENIKKLASENRALSGDVTNCFASENRLEMSY